MNLAFNVEDFEIIEGRILLRGNFPAIPRSRKTIEADQASAQWVVRNGVWYRLLWTDSQLQRAFATRLALG